MSVYKEFRLVEGQFPMEDAKDILSKLIADKIRYHELKLFSINERFGTEDEHSVNRLKDLTESLQMIQELMSMEVGSGKTVIIKANVELNII